MALADHLRELRARLLRSVVAIVVVFALMLFFYDSLLDLVLAPTTRRGRPSATTSRPRPTSRARRVRCFCS